MSNVLKTVSEIQAAFPPFQEWLPTHKQYLAHTHKDAASEPFEAHVRLVNEYFGELCRVHGLDSVIDSLINSLVENTFSYTETHRISELVKKYFVMVVYFHDFGKVNDNFQADPKK